MKTLEKLNINPERIIKNEELVTLRGGYDVFICRRSDNTICSEGSSDGHCEMMWWVCEISCQGDWASSICVSN